MPDVAAHVKEVSMIQFGSLMFEMLSNFHKLCMKLIYTIIISRVLPCLKSKTSQSHMPPFPLPKNVEGHFRLYFPELLDKNNFVTAEIISIL